MDFNQKENAARSVPDFAVLVLLCMGAWWLLSASPSITIKPPAPRHRPAAVAVSGHDLDAATRVAIFETRGEPRLGKIAVAHVMVNRMRKNPYGWRTLGDVVKAPKQFEPWYLHQKRLAKINVKGREYRNMKLILQEALAGRTADPTHGAFYFLNVKVVKGRGMSSAWKKIIAHKGCRDIARHRFCPMG